MYIMYRYIHKLFDRSVDFAKFNNDTSLYVLARAWMKNKPNEVEADSAPESPNILVRKFGYSHNNIVYALYEVHIS